MAVTTADHWARHQATAKCQALRAGMAQQAAANGGSVAAGGAAANAQGRNEEGDVVPEGDCGTD